MNTTAQNAAQLIVDCARENGYLDGPLSCIPTLAEEEKKLFVDMSERVHKDRFILGNYTYYLSKRSLY